MKLTKNDYKVLYKLYEYGSTTEMKAITIQRLEEITELSNSKLRTSLKIFRELEMLSEGALDKNAKTYFITEDGINKIVKMMEG